MVSPVSPPQPNVDHSDSKLGNIARQTKSWTGKSNLSFRQLLSANLVKIGQLKHNLHTEKFKKKSSIFFWFRRKKIRFIQKEINKLQFKNRYLRRSIAREDKRQELLSYLGKSTKDIKTSMRAKFQRTNFRLFEAEIKQYLRRYFIFDLLKTALGSLFITIAFVYFINDTGATGIFPSGLSAISKLIASVIAHHNSEKTSSLFFLIYLTVNIPLVIFAFWKISFKFGLLSLCFMLFQNIFNIIIEKVYFLKPSFFQALIDFQRLSHSHTEPTDYLLWLFVFAICAALFTSLGASLVYRSGGSTGGVDFLSGYVQKQKIISIGQVNFIINVGVFLLVFMINTIIISDQDLKQYFSNPADYQRSRFQLQYFFGPSLFASLLMLFMVTVLLNYFYPKYRYLLVKIKTTLPNDIIGALRHRGFPTSIERMTKIEHKHNFAHSPVEYLELRCSMTDWKEVKTIIFLIDDQAIVSTSLLYSFQGQKLIDAFWR